jgi:hypothetical protein
MMAAEEKGGHTGPPLRGDPESIISFAIARAVREQPDQAGAEMLKLIQENARLEAENAMLKARIAHLAGLDWRLGFSG